MSPTSMLTRLCVIACTVATGVAACALRPPRYSFGTPATMPNPTRGAPVGDGIMVARDGTSRHRLVQFTPAAACFESELDGPETQRLQGMTFTLRGFVDPQADLRHVPSLDSSSVTVLDTSARVVAGDTPYNSPITDLRVCFENPGRVIGPTTRYLVLGAGYDATDEHDGVWQLQ